MTVQQETTQQVAISGRVADEYDLTRIQREVWASQRLFPNAPVANMATVHRIDGRVDPERFVAAFDAVVRASDALRTVVGEREGRPVGRVLARPPATTDVIELDHEDLDAWVGNRISTPVDVSSCAYDSVLLRHADDAWTWWLDLHHLVTDGWSQAFVTQLTGVAYADGGLGDTELVSFAEHTAVERAEQIAPPGPHQTVTIRPLGVRGPTTTRSSRSFVDVDVAALESALDGEYRSISAELGRLSVLAAALAVTMHRLDGGDSHAIGVPVHHRSGRDGRRVVGPLMELHAVVVEVRPDDTFADLVSRTLASVIEMLRAVRRGTATQHRFELVVNVFDGAYGDFAGMGMEASWVRASHVDPAHVVRLHAFDYGAGMRVEMDVNDALHTPHRPTRLAEHVAAVIDSIVSNPAMPVCEARLATDDDLDELARLVPVAPAGPVRPVHETIRDRLRAAPERVVASTTSGERVTALEFDQRVERCVVALRRSGVGPGDRVGLRMHRSVEVLVAIQAILRAGGAFVMLDPDDPPARHDAIVDDAGLVTIVDDLDDLIADGDDVGPREVGSADDAEPVELDDLAYILYTSGSTGAPKGVPISHRGLADYLAFAVAAYCDPQRPPVVALHSALVFDLTITSLFLAFLSGGRVKVFGGDPIVALGRIATDDEVTFLKATPSQLEVFARLVDDPRCIETVVVGGEAFRRPVAAATAAVCAPDVRIFNEYGPTEAVVGCMIHEWDCVVDDGIDVPIGHAAPGCEVAIVDVCGQPAPAGAWGELYVRRVGMATEYLNQPELSAERFVGLERMPGQLGGDERGPWYRTGDRVRVERPGVAVYGGRFDDQMKVNGVRLEPAEVEAALVEHPRIASAIVRLWTPANRATTQRCARCGLGDDVPGVVIDAGECSVCRSFDEVAPQAEAWFRDEADLDAALDRARRRSTGDYDCLHLLSGGKDSSYALYQLVERGWRVHALTLDNGFISDGAKENIRRSIDALGITHEFATTGAMNEIFRDSLDRHANVCQGCYKTIYTLAVARADELGIPVVVTGLSRGQFFETRLIPAQFEAGRFDPEAIDATVLEARKVYHRIPDAVTRLLPEQAVFDDDDIFDRVEFVDFYRYVDVDLTELYRYLEENAPWVRPTDTGRSTNCLINVAGIQVHRSERGYHNYAEPYSWDVRLGHKTRAEALDELDDEVDDDDVTRLLAEVGYEPKNVMVLTAWYQTDDGEDLEPDELRRFVRDRIAEHATPAAFVHVRDIPMSASAKADVAALPPPLRVHRRSAAVVEPDTSTEAALCSIWADVLRLERVGVADDFFDVGGDSLAALEVVAALDEALGVAVDDAAVFHARTVRELARVVEAARAERLSSDEIPALLDSGPAPLSAGEEAMLFEYRRNPDDTRYNVTRWYRLPAEVDIERLDAAIRDVAMLHGPLHTSYAKERTPMSRDRAVVVERLAPMSPERFGELADEQRARPFDLDRGPLVRVDVAPHVDGSATSLLVGMHHISIDAGTFDVFWSQVSAIYSGAAVPVPDVTYAAHGAWQRTSVQPLHGAYWAARRAENTALRNTALRSTAPGAVAVVAPNPAESDGYLHRRIDLTTTQLRRGPGSTPFVAALTAAASTAARWSGASWVEIGITASVKDHAATSGLVGYFLNTLPITIDASADQPVSALADSVDRLVVEAIEHRTYPFASIVRDARRAGAQPPDVSFMLAYERLAPAELGGVAVEHEILASGTAVSDVTLFVQERGEHLAVGIEYSGASISSADAGRMLDTFATLLTAGARQPGATSAELCSGDGSPSELVGVGLGPTSVTVLHDLFLHVGAAPDAIAVVDGFGRSLTFCEMTARAVRLAETIEEADRSGRYVGVSLARSVDLVVGILAALLAGRGYVPLDPAAPASRVRAIVDDVELGVVLTDSANAERFEQSLVVSDATIASSASGEADVADLLDEVGRRVEDIDAEDPAYVIFTSGSTGRPRGVEVSHANLVASTSARRVTYGAGPQRFLLTSSIGFDSSMVGLFWPLSTGGTIVLPTDDEVHDVDRLGSRILDDSVTHLLMVPSLYRALLTRAATKVDSLRVAIVAGEAASGDLASLHVTTFSDRAALFNEYGPTEATVWATVHRHDVTEESRFDGGAGLPIGGPIAGVTVRVADGHGVALPTGVAGELLISGPTVTRGYVGVDVATSDRFVTVDGRRWYRTGDLVRIGRHGALDFLGRVDDQLNLGGVRLEPTEIEAVLMSFGAVTDAVVVASDEPRPRLVAHVEGADIDEVTLRMQLSDILPGTHVPARIVRHDALPRTSHGKLDRRAAGKLSIPLAAGPGAAERAVEVSGHLVDVVVSAWSSALGREDITSQTDYFEAGGDSLAAVEIVSTLEDALGRAVPIGLLLDGRTPAGLAALLDPADAARQQRVATSRLVTMQAGTGRAPIVVCTPGWDDVFGYRDLTDALPDDVTVLALSAAEVSPTDIVTTVPELTDSFAECLEVAAALPAGRELTVLGWSTGGVVAYDLAERLDQAGQRVARIAMIDTFFPGAEQHLWSNRWWKYKSLLGPGAFFGEVRTTARRRAKALAKSIGTKLLRYSGTPVPETPKRTSTGGVPLEAFGYRPAPTEIPVVFFAASTTNPDRTYRGWQGVADVDVVPVAGRHRGHQSIMDADRVGAIADDVARRIDATRDART